LQLGEQKSVFLPIAQHYGMSDFVFADGCRTNQDAFSCI